MKHLRFNAQYFVFLLRQSDIVAFKRFLYHFMVSVLILLTPAFFSGCSTVKSAKLLVPENFGMDEIAPQVYVEKEMSPSQREAFIKMIDTARQRIHLYYGNVLSKPEFIACTTEICFQSLGGISDKAIAFGKSRILLSPRGMAVPVITHEWSHAELHTRVENFFGRSNIPRWFDEGLAVVVSNEPEHSEAVWQGLQKRKITCPDFTALQTKNEWLGSTEKYDDASFAKEGYNVLHSCVGHEVRSWYRKAGRLGLAHLIETNRFNVPFEQAYIEARGGNIAVKR